MVKPGLQIWTDDYADCVGNYHFRRFALTDEDIIATYKKLYLDNVLFSIGLIKSRFIIGRFQDNNGLIYVFSVGDTFFVLSLFFNI